MSIFSLLKLFAIDKGDITLYDMFNKNTNKHKRTFLFLKFNSGGKQDE